MSHQMQEDNSTWSYFDLVKPAGFAEDFEALYQFDGSADEMTDRSGNGHTLVKLCRRPRKDGS